MIYETFKPSNRELMFAGSSSLVDLIIYNSKSSVSHRRLHQDVGEVWQTPATLFTADA